MSQTIDTVVEQLMRESDEFRQLKRDHADFEKRLDALAEKPFLSTDEQVEVAQIKKKKLILKDRMAEIAKAAAVS